jgi:bacillithiol biosynthesis cysteine-adding enzyme BshC
LLHQSIPFAQTGLYSRIILDYINGADTIRPFYEYTPSVESLREAMDNRTFTAEQRNVLADVLKRQYADAGISLKDAKLVAENIELLKDANTFTITTGHQLAVFTGPLFFIYKILSTIRLAQEAREQYPDKRFVPVFWMASEDHDFEEINHIHLKGEKISWEFDSAHQPVGILPTASLGPVIARIRELLGDKAVGKEKLITLFEEAYTCSKTLSEATQKIVHTLFATYGLVIIEPNDKVLKEQLTGVMENDILSHNSFGALTATNARLERNKYRLQIHGREINFFYLSAEGRNLIKRTADGFEISQTSIRFTEAAMQEEIKTHPERFSPNVVLRPVYQEKILPNLAYIGGPGEIAYWLQLKFVFQAHGVDFPMVVLRNSVTLMQSATLHRLRKKGVSTEQLFLKEEDLIKAYIAQEHPLQIEQQVAELDAIAQQTIDLVMPFDNRIASDLIAWKAGMNEYMSRARKEIIRKKKEKSDADIQQLIEIRQSLFPANGPQERYETLLQHTGDYYPYFLNALATSMRPLSHTMDILLND